jgi:ABC-type nickel/cobalt efflux system permease component RcnA
MPAQSELLALVSSEGFRVGLLATAYGFGFRHGIDWDHIAAITDITSSQEEGRQSIALATLYALGHGLVVFCLGLGAILLGEKLPTGVDAVMGRVVGATLLALGVFVFWSLFRHGRDFRMRSRWMLVFAGIRRGARWMRNRHVVIDHEHAHDERHHPDLPDGPSRAASPADGAAAVAPASTQTTTKTAHAHSHRHLGTLPDDPFATYGRATAFGVGMLHGVGAETPTQILLFVAAAGVGGRTGGVFMLGAFLLGLLSSNSLIALASTFGFLRATRNFAVYATVAVVTGSFSLAIGTLFLLGHDSVLPAIFGG